MTSWSNLSSKITTSGFKTSFFFFKWILTEYIPIVSVIGGGGFIQMVRVVIYINTNIDFRNLKDVDTHFRDTFSTSPIQPSSTFLWAQFMYYILFYSFKHGPSPCDLWGKLRKCGLKGMGRFLSDLL